VVSNSDSINDQMLKLKVTDAINNYIQNITANINDKDKYILAIKENIQNILNIAQSTLVSNNSSYNITAQLGNIKYEEKSFNKKIMKAGTYPSLKIVIGEGKGENWWSLLYPSLPDNLTVEEALENGEIKFEFKTLDVFNHFINFLNDNNIIK
jgi:stage II sporulation protein R